MCAFKRLTVKRIKQSGADGSFPAERPLKQLSRACVFAQPFTSEAHRRWQIRVSIEMKCYTWNPFQELLWENNSHSSHKQQSVAWKKRGGWRGEWGGQMYALSSACSNLFVIGTVLFMACLAFLWAVYCTQAHAKSRLMVLPSLCFPCQIIVLTGLLLSNYSVH